MKNFVLAIMLAVFGIGAIQAQETICINGKCYQVVRQTVTQSVPQNVQVMSSDASANALIPVFNSDSAKFRRVLLEAARRQRASGDISIGQHLMVIKYSRKVAQLDELKMSIHELAIEDGLATTQAINWDALLAFIEKLMPFILQLIGAIGGGGLGSIDYHNYGNFSLMA